MPTNLAVIMYLWVFGGADFEYHIRYGRFAGHCEFSVENNFVLLISTSINYLQHNSPLLLVVKDIFLVAKVTPSGVTLATPLKIPQTLKF